MEWTYRYTFDIWIFIASLAFFARPGGCQSRSLDDPPQSGLAIPPFLNLILVSTNDPCHVLWLSLLCERVWWC